jgi:hypothetical protein
VADSAGVYCDALCCIALCVLCLQGSSGSQVVAGGFRFYKLGTFAWLACAVSGAVTVCSYAAVGALIRTHARLLLLLLLLFAGCTDAELGDDDCSQVWAGLVHPSLANSRAGQLGSGPGCVCGGAGCLAGRAVEAEWWEQQQGRRQAFKCKETTLNRTILARSVTPFVNADRTATGIRRSSRRKLG